MHSIELLLDTATDAAVRRAWQELADAGLPSQARHTGETNAPHVTLAARPVIEADTDDELASLAATLPEPVWLGSLVVFGRGPRGLVLARLVVPSRGILRLHEQVHEIAPDPDGSESTNTLPAQWTPHVTLASRLTLDEIGRAVDVAAADPHDGEFTTLRRWDSTTRRVTLLGGGRDGDDRDAGAGLRR